MKKLTFLLIFICNLMASNQVSQTNDFTNIEKEYIATKTITIGMLVDYYPFSFKENGKINGYSYDYINLIMKKSGLKIKIEMDTWSNNLNKFQTNKIDLIDAISYKKSRESYTNFSKTYFKIPNVIFSRKNDFNNYSGFESLKGKKIGITKDIYYYNEIKNLQLFELVEFKSSRDKMKALAYGKLDAIFNNLISGQKYINQGAYSNIKVLEELDSKIVKKEDLRIGINKKDNILLSIINKTMNSITRKEKKELDNKWFETQLPQVNTINNSKSIDTVNLTQKEKEYLKSKKTLTVANLKSFPPFNFYENEIPKGYTVDYLKLMEKYLDTKVKFISHKSWNEYLIMLKNKEIDLIPHVAITQKRKEYLDFTSFNHIEYTTGIAVSKNSNISSIKDLKDKIIAVTNNSFLHTYLKEKFPNYTLLLVASTAKAVESLSKGKADAVIGSLPAINYYIQKNWLLDIKTITISDLGQTSKTVLPMAVSKGNEILKSILEKTNESIPYSEIIALKEKWMNVSSTNNLTQEETIYLKNKKKIRMCVLPDWLPFEQIDENGNHKGIGADIMKIISQYIDTPIELIPTKEWSKSLSNIKDRKCDILPVAMNTPSRRNSMNFTNPYVKEPFVIATHNKELFIKYSKELSNKKIGIVKSYAFIEVLKSRNPDIEIVGVKNTEEGLKQVSSGELFGYIDTMPTIGYGIQKYSMFDLKIAGKLEFDIELSIASRNDEPLLNSIMQKSLDTISEEKKRTIIGKWIEIKVVQEFDYTLLWQIGFGFLIILLVIVYKQYMANKSVNEMTELIDSTIEAILISKNGICIDANQSAIEMFGLDSKKEIVGTHILEIVAIESMELAKQKILLDNYEPYESIILKKNKVKFPALVRGHNLKGINARITSLIDITHLKKLESQSKLASMGEMIGNIAHQWRQPLSVISTASTGIIMQKEYGLLDESKLIETCNIINDNAQYLSKTIDDFKNFIKGDRAKKIFNLTDCIHSFLHLVQGSIKRHNIRIVTDIEENIKIDGYENELIQCLIIIFNNSKDALQENNRSSRNKIIFISTAYENDKAILKIKDNGKGIAIEILPKIFEPYFTTKHSSQGTGLGLHMSYNLIVDGMKGSIEANNVNFEYDGIDYTGAELTIKLPLK